MLNLNAAFGRFAAGGGPSATAAEPAVPAAPSADGLLDGQRRQNKLLQALRDDLELRDLLLRAAAETQASSPGSHDDVALYVLLPQSVTLDDVRITRELVETHLVHLERRPSRSGASGAAPSAVSEEHARRRRTKGRAPP